MRKEKRVHGITGIRAKELLVQTPMEEEYKEERFEPREEEQWV